MNNKCGSKNEKEMLKKKKIEKVEIKEKKNKKEKELG